MNEQLARTYSRSPVPLYLQVAAALRRRIEDGYWKANEKISTLEELEREFHVARVTVRQAIEILQNEGLVRRKQGKGTFVSAGLKDKRWLRLDLKWSSLIRAIESQVPTFIDVEIEPEAPDLGDDEGRPAKGYKFLKSVQSRDGEPFALATVFVARRIFDQSPEKFLSKTALTALSATTGVKIGSARQSFIIGSADMEAADRLRIPLGAPTAEARIVVLDDKGIAIYVGNVVYRGDSVRLDIDLLG
jgi:GntR family transcriptional regulator